VARRLAAFLVLILAAAALAGCEDASQRDARRALQAKLRQLPDEGGYLADDVHCTHDARVVLDPVRTTRYYCTAPRPGGDCDWFRVDARASRPPRIVLVRRNAGCVLPAG
jgi:hypothetical protein